MRNRSTSRALVFILALLTMPWLSLPYRRLDWVAFSQPYELTSTATTAPTITPSPGTPLAGPLPDLVIISARVSMRDYTGGCVTEFAPLMTRVCVRNQGAAPAGSFLIRADAYGGGTLEWTVEGLAAGEKQCLEREAAAFGQVTLDAGNDVTESDETLQELERIRKQYEQLGHTTIELLGALNALIKRGDAQGSVGPSDHEIWYCAKAALARALGEEIDQ
jgi:hypothetical protein